MSITFEIKLNSKMPWSWNLYLFQIPRKPYQVLSMNPFDSAVDFHSKMSSNFYVFKRKLVTKFRNLTKKYFPFSNALGRSPWLASCFYLNENSILRTHRSICQAGIIHLWRLHSGGRGIHNFLDYLRIAANGFCWEEVIF